MTKQNPGYAFNPRNATDDALQQIVASFSDGGDSETVISCLGRIANSLETLVELIFTNQNQNQDDL